MREDHIPEHPHEPVVRRDDATVQAVLDALPGYALLVDEAHEILAANRAVTRDLKVRPEDIVGRPCPMAVHGTEGPHPHCPLERCVRAGLAAAEERFEEHGRWLHSQVHQTSLRTPDGRRTYLHLLRDRTAQREAQDELRRNYDTQRVVASILQFSLEERPLDEILEQTLRLCLSLPWLAVESKACIFLAGEEPETLEMRAHVNLDQLAALCGRVPFGHCLCGRAARDKVPIESSGEDDRHDVVPPGGRAHGHLCVPILGGSRLLGVLNAYLPAGYAPRSAERRFFESVADAVAGVVLRKQSERRQRERERELRASELRLRQLFEGSADGVLIADPRDRSFVLSNARLRDMLGYSSEDILRMGVDDLHPPKDLPRILEAYERQACGEVALATDIPVLRKDGSVLYADVASSRIDVEGVPLLLGSFRDVSARRALEAQLHHAQKMEAVGRLAGGIAHDFNNVLTVVLTCSELALDGLPPDDPLLPDLQEIREAAQRASSLTRQLLAFSRRQVLDPQDVSLDEVVPEILGMLRRVLGENVHISTRLASEEVEIAIDPTQLDQILVNLAVNARDAMPDGGRLTLQTRPVVLAEPYPGGRPGRHALLEVTDTGCGMAEETQALVFEPFYTTKDPGKGTGLGLATVHGIVRQSGGHIEVTSEIGAGTTFRLYFPETSGKAPRAAPAPPEAGALPRGEETVLVVEDEEAVRRVTARVLREAGYRVLTADDGPGAARVEAAHDGPIQAILCDLVLPGPSGRETIEELVRRRPDARVLYMSGRSDEAVSRLHAGGGRARLLRKPLSRAELLCGIREVLDEPIGTDSAAAG